MSPAEVVFSHSCAMPFRLLTAYVSLPIVRTWRAKEDAFRLQARRNNAALRTNSRPTACLPLW